MGWIGPWDRIEDCLKARADKDDDGKYLIRGDKVVSFLGMGEEFCLGDDTEILIKGEWTPLIPLLYGGMRVTVI